MVKMYLYFMWFGRLQTSTYFCLEIIMFPLYSVLQSPVSDVTRLFAKRISKSHAPSEIAHTGSCSNTKTKSAHALKSCTCVLPAFPWDCDGVCLAISWQWRHMLFAKRISKSHAPSEIVHTEKQRVCACNKKLHLRANSIPMRWRRSIQSYKPIQHTIPLTLLKL